VPKRRSAQTRDAPCGGRAVCQAARALATAVGGLD